MPASLLLGTITIDPICDTSAAAPEPLDDSTLEAILTSLATHSRLDETCVPWWTTKPRWTISPLGNLAASPRLHANLDQLLLDLEAEYESLVG